MFMKQGGVEREERKIMIWVKEPPLSWRAKASWAKSLLCSWPFCVDSWCCSHRSRLQAGLRGAGMGFSSFWPRFPFLSGSSHPCPLPPLPFLYSFQERHLLCTCPSGSLVLLFLTRWGNSQENKRKDVRSEVRLSVPLSPHWSRGCIPYLQLPV